MLIFVYCAHSLSATVYKEWILHTVHNYEGRQIHQLLIPIDVTVQIGGLHLEEDVKF